MGLYEWAVQQGYRRVGYEYKIGSDGEPFSRPTTFPRRLMGEYLAWFYEALLVDAPANLEIVRHYAAASVHHPEIGGHEKVSAGRRISVEGRPRRADLWVTRSMKSERPTQAKCATSDPIRLSTSTLPWRRASRCRRRDGPSWLRPNTRRSRSVAAVRTPTRETDALRRRVAVEPVIYFYSRSGVPYCAKSAHGVDPTGDYQPIVCTPAAFREMTNPSGSPLRRRVDFRTDLLPLLFAEFRRAISAIRSLRGGPSRSRLVREELRRVGSMGLSIERSTSRIHLWCRSIPRGPLRRRQRAFRLQRRSTKRTSTR